MEHISPKSQMLAPRVDMLFTSHKKTGTVNSTHKRPRLLEIYNQYSEVSIFLKESKKILQNYICFCFFRFYWSLGLVRKDLPLSLFTSCSRSQHSTWSIVLTFVLNELRNKLLLLCCSLSLFFPLLTRH